MAPSRHEHDQFDESDEDVALSREDALGLPKRERDYVVPATDAKNQSIRAMCRMQPAYWRIASEIIASKKYPFRVMGDLFRWCIVDGIKRLAQGAGINSVVAHADTIMTILTDEDYQLQFAENFTAMKRVVDRYVERNATSKARELVTRIRSEIDKMPEGYWRDQYTNELETKYGQLLDGLRGSTANSGGTGVVATIEHDEH